MDKCLLFQITDDYSYQLATTLLSLQDNSSDVFNSSDIIVYHTGISERNKNALKKIRPDIKYINIYDDNYLPQQLYKSAKFKSYLHPVVLAKINGFNLCSAYKQILYMDVDMLVLKDISPLFNYNEPVAWMPSRSVNPHTMKNVYNLKDNNFDVHLCFGCLVLFNTALTDFNITKDDIIQAQDFYAKHQDINIPQSMEEIMLSCLCYNKQIPVARMHRSSALSACYCHEEDIKILHFMLYKGSKHYAPWSGSAHYAAFPLWQYYYKKWLSFGGTGPKIDHTKNNFYNQAYTYKTLLWHENYQSLLHLLDAIKHPFLETDWETFGDDLQFFIKGIPKDIFYSIERSYCEDALTLSLNLKGKTYFTAKVVELFTEIFETINKKIANVKFVNTNILNISLPSNMKNTNFCFNLLINESLPKIKKHFENISGHAND